MQQSANKISIQQIMEKTGTHNHQSSSIIKKQRLNGDDASFDQNQPQNLQLSFIKINQDKISINEVLNDSSQINLSHVATASFPSIKQT